MENAHLRMGKLEFRRFSEKISTLIHVRVDRYMGEMEQGHLISAFAGDAEIGAISAAVAEHSSFTLTFPGGESHTINMGEAAACFRGQSTSEESNRCDIWSLSPRQSSTTDPPARRICSITIPTSPGTLLPAIWASRRRPSGDRGFWGCSGVKSALRRSKGSAANLSVSRRRGTSC